ncbi:hypothetical protein ABK040_008904 [Willaertia magna]
MNETITASQETSTTKKLGNALEDNRNENERDKEEEQQEEEHHEMVHPPMTPIPYKKLLVVFIIYLVDSLSITSLFSYIGYMIKDFNIVSDSSKYAYFAGILASSFYLSQLFSSFVWGYLSDRIGRRPILIFGVTGGSIACFLFGFSYYYWLAIISRFTFGLLNGNIGVVKSYLSEITDSSNRAKAFSIIGVTFGMAAVIGPLIGGTFARPNAQYPKLMELFPSPFVKFLDIFPYLLPNLIIACLGLFCTLLGYIYLQETNTKGWYYKRFVQKKDENPVEMEEHHVRSLGNEEEMAYHEEKDNVVNNEETQETEIKEDIANDEGIVEEDNKPILTNGLGKRHEIFQGLNPILSCFLLAGVGFVGIMFDELLPLFVMLPVEQHGLNFTPFDIGIACAITGLVIFFNQLVFVPMMLTKFGSLNSFRMALIVHTIALVAFPEVSWLGCEDDAPIGRVLLLWIVLMSLIAFRQLGVGVLFSSSFVMTANVVTNQSSGVLNGVANTILAIAKLLAPVVVGTLFSGVLGLKKSFPLDFRLIFYFIALIGVILLGITFFMKKTVDFPKEELKEYLLKGMTIEEALEEHKKKKKLRK